MRAPAVMRLAGIATGTHSQALLDQAIVSGTSFLTMVLVARASNSDELGIYALVTSLLLPWVSIQESLIALPYTISRHRTAVAPRQHAGAFLIFTGLLALVAVLFFGVTVAGLSIGHASEGLVQACLVLAAIVPFALLRDFGRRFEFAHLEMRRALVLDIVAAVVQIAGLCLLAFLGKLTAASACAAIGLSCAIAGLGWCRSSRRQFVLRQPMIRPVAAEGWGIGKWLFATQLTLSLQIYVTYWLLGFFVGIGATGIYAACASIVLIANPVLLGMSNIVAPKAALALNKGGIPSLNLEVRRNTLLLGVGMAAFSFLVMIGGDAALAIFFPKLDVAGHTSILFVLSLAMLASAVGMPSSKALAVIDRPRAVFWCSLIALVLTAVLVTLLVSRWGLLGAAIGVLAGNFAGSVARIAAFAWYSRMPSAAVAAAGEPPNAVTRVMQQFAPDSGNDPWHFEYLGAGCQADVLIVRRRDGQPVWQDQARLVVKLYNPVVGQNPEMIRRQSAAFARFHEALNGITLIGWRITVPRPLYTSEQPAALVMTLAEGATLDSCLRNAAEDGTAAVKPVALAVIAALQRCWSQGLIHGDLNPDNILCNRAGKELAFVDVGIPLDEPPYAGEAGHRDPASEDLAYLLFDAAAQVKSGIGPGNRYRLRRNFAVHALRAAIDSCGTRDEKTRLLDGIAACSHKHLGAFSIPWSSPRGLWCRVVQRITERRMSSIVIMLRTDAARTPARA